MRRIEISLTGIVATTTSRQELICNSLQLAGQHRREHMQAYLQKPPAAEGE